MTQNECLLKHLEAGEEITPLSALSMCGTLRLSERIREIERSGVLIDHEMIKVGEKRICRYSMLKIAYG